MCSPLPDYLRDLMQTLSTSLPHAVFVCLSAAHIGDVLEECGLEIDATAEVEQRPTARSVHACMQAWAGAI